MKLQKTIVALGTLILSLTLTTNAYADGGEVKVTEKEVCVEQYGGGTECHTEKITEEVTHETVDAGIEDMNYLSLTLIAGGASLFFYTVSKMTNGVYLLDK